MRTTLLAAFFLLCLVGCGNSGERNKNKNLDRPKSAHHLLIHDHC